jgi:hypothetical protein
MVEIVKILKNTLIELNTAGLMDFKSVSADLPDVLDSLDGYNQRFERRRGFKLNEEHLQWFFLPSEFHLTWRAKNDTVSGEINLQSLSDILIQGTLEISYDDSDQDEEEKTKVEFLKKAHCFDVPSRTVISDTGVVMLWDKDTMSYPELWFMDHYEKFYPLELDLGTYFEALAITKGMSYWQIFYLNREDYKKVRRYYTEPTELMYREFKKLFPNQDYTDLERRFSERVTEA